MNEIITNGAEIKQRILSEINNATQSIYLAMAWFTDRDIATAIIEAKTRNVFVDVILSSNAQNETVKTMLRGSNISVHAFETGDARGIMHHKFCLIDSKISINGSYNYSYNASNNNVENIHVSDNLNIYQQLFSEFERLKYNIDHNIGVNEVNTIPENTPPITQPMNNIETFAQQLQNLVYSAAQVNCDNYKKKGYDTSKESQGNIDIFRTEYDRIKEEIRAHATDEGLSSIRNILASNILNAFESTKAGLEAEKQNGIIVATKDNDLEKRQILVRINEAKEQKLILESGNTNTGERGLLQINKDIEKNKLERKALEQSFVVKKFWTAGTKLIAGLLFIFLCYLCIFFSSALYKMLFESDTIRVALEAGINPGLPKLVDANAIIKIFRQQGLPFGFIAMIFFLFPILLSNLKLLGSENERINNLLFWVGLLVFDVVVAAMIAINTDEIKSLLVGKESTLAIWEVVKHGEFWMIFIFGTIPLIITHYLIENIVNAYKGSLIELIDGEKNKMIKILDDELIELNFEKEDTTTKIKDKQTVIDEFNDKILNLEKEINNQQNQIEAKYAELQKQIKNIYDEFNAKIISGRIFTDVILDSVSSAYKSGYIEHLPEYYSTEEVANRVKEIEQIITNK